MHCKKCGKAIGTDRGICPFCGAMLSKEQMEIYSRDKKSDLRARLLTEKYGEKKIVYEKQKEDNGLVFILIAIIFLVCIFLIILLNLVLK